MIDGTDIECSKTAYINADGWQTLTYDEFSLDTASKYQIVAEAEDDAGSRSLFVTETASDPPTPTSTPTPSPGPSPTPDDPTPTPLAGGDGIPGPGIVGTVGSSVGACYLLRWCTNTAEDRGT